MGICVSLSVCVLLPYLHIFLCLKIRSVWPGCVLVFLFMQWALRAHLSSETVRKSLALRLPGQPQCNLQCDKEFRILDFVALNLPWCNLQWAEQSHLLGFVALKLLYWKYTMLKYFKVQIWLHWGYQASYNAIIHCASCFHNTLVYVCLSKSCLKFWIYFCSPLQWMMTYIGSSGWGSSNLSDPRGKMRGKCCWARNCLPTT